MPLLGNTGGLLPLPEREGWGEGVTGLSAAVTPSPPPSPQVGRGSSTERVAASYITSTAPQLKLEIDEWGDATGGGDGDEEDDDEGERHFHRQRGAVVAQLQALEPVVGD